MKDTKNGKEKGKKIGKVSRPEGSFVYVNRNGDVMAFQPKKRDRKRTARKTGVK